MPDSPGADRLCHALFDDAALFPPAKLAMARAVAAHARHQGAWYGFMSGPFVCPDTRLAELQAVLTAANVLAIELAVVVGGGAGNVAGAMDAAAADPRLRLRAVEVPAATGDADPAAAAGDVADALDAALPAGVNGYVEIGIDVLAGSAGPQLTALLADRGYRPKLRTGGVTAAAFPDEGTLACCLAAVTDRRLAFKCTAGLHHAVRNADATTGFEQHGFLNVLLATGAGLDGAHADKLAEVLSWRDAADVARRIRCLSLEAAQDIRGSFASFGTCSTDEPVADLVGLGLASQAAGAPSERG